MVTIYDEGFPCITYGIKMQEQINKSKILSPLLKIECTVVYGLLPCDTLLIG